MTEDFLHYVWKYKLFNQNNLQTVSGEPVRIVNSGTWNKESGPDFFDARIEIGGLTWAGQVEIHLRASDWYAHRHEQDAAYTNVVLHVVWENDADVTDAKGRELPSVVLKGRVSQTLINRYERFHTSTHDFVCSGMTSHLDGFKTNQWLDRLLIERLEDKTGWIRELHEKWKSNWSQVFFVVLAKNLGFKTNALPMQWLAQSINFKILLKARTRLDVLESILFGVSGLLRGEGEYESKLRQEFTHQCVKYGFEPLESSIWKFGRIRPSNFPTLRLAQLAQLIHRFGDMFEVLVRDFDTKWDIRQLNVTASGYWDTHYTFEKKSEAHPKTLGDSSVHNILINSVVPMLFFYGQQVGSYLYQDKAVTLLEHLTPENNHIVKKWKSNNIVAQNASQSQALIQLSNSYCKPKRCLQCGIGSQILNKNHDRQNQELF